MGRLEDEAAEAGRALVRTIEQARAEAAADARRPYALAIEANLTKLKQLQQDADAKLWGPDRSESDHTYWSGWHDGITRAIKVLEGRG